MKVRDSGMPEEEMWADFFDAEEILRTFGLDQGVVDLAEFGSGYGTFTLAAARMVPGIVHALDIEPELIGLVEEKCRQAGITNVSAKFRDFVGQGSGLAEQSVDAALLFNILHHDQPLALFAEAWRVLKPKPCGVCAVIHWNFDPTTPRGPAMEIRPRPEQCIVWGQQAGFLFKERYDLPPYHYGLLFKKDQGEQGR